MGQPGETSRKLINVPLLEVRHLKKSYGSHLAVADVSFELSGGEVLGLLGPNGAGKSTTMLMIAGLLTPDAGEVLVDGEVFNPQDPIQRQSLGVVPQELALYPELNAWENLRFFGKLYGIRGNLLEERCQHLLEQVGLIEAGKRAAREYSGGMKRRLNFAIALIHGPRIVILDEPTVGVDPQSRSHLMDCIRAVAADGVGVIYASHYMEEVEALCQRVAIIDHGRMLAFDKIDTLLSGMSADLHLTVTGPKLNGQLTDLANIVHPQEGEQTVIIPASSGDRGEVLREVLTRLDKAGVHVDRIETQQTNLERLFLQLTGHRLRD
ncbi:ATP-binding cassette domain-containing protein [bacterium]|nr:ATP-binding cassette domain-containing protein [bacterium]